MNDFSKQEGLERGPREEALFVFTRTNTLAFVRTWPRVIGSRPSRQLTGRIKGIGDD